MSYSQKFSLDNKSTVEDEKQTGTIGTSISDINFMKKDDEHDYNESNSLENEYQVNNAYENRVVADKENNRNQKREEIVIIV